MIDIEEIKEELKSILSIKRYEHSLGAMEKAIELAEIFGEDKEKAAYTALTHDIAKEMSIEEMIDYALKNGIELTKEDKLITRTLHGIIGADIVKKNYGFTQEMQDAIYYHTTGRENMTLLDKIVFLADKSEKGREGEDAENLRNVIETEGLDKAILWDIDYYTIPRMINKQKMIHPNSIYARNDLIRITKENEI